jgi:hypothetical protein
MNWLRDLFQQWKAWGDLWMRSWLNIKPIQNIEVVK